MVIAIKHATQVHCLVRRFYLLWGEFLNVDGHASDWSSGWRQWLDLSIDRKRSWW